MFTKKGPSGTSDVGSWPNEPPRYPQGRRQGGGGFPVVPNTRIRDPSGQLPPALTDASSGPNRVQLQTAGRDSIIPILYGGPERMAGLLYWVGSNGTYLFVVNIYCEGPVGQILKSDIEINDVPAYDGAVPGDTPNGETRGTLVNVYDGSQVTPDPYLSSNFGWTETLEGFAYSVVVISAPSGTAGSAAEAARTWVTGFPRVTAKIKGKKVYDPRADASVAGSGACTLADSSTWIWTDNPALCLADFLYSYCGRTVEASTLVTAANQCDTTIVFGSPTPFAEKSSTMTLALMDKKPVEEWIDILRGYLPGWVQDHGDFVRVIVDAAGAAEHTFDSSNIAQEPAPRLSTRGIREVPNVVEVGYTETSTLPYSPGTGSRNFTNYVAVGTGSTKARLELPGIRSYSMARRFAVTRYNHYHLEPIEGEISVFDYGVRVMPGDRATITEAAWGWTNTDVRILETRDNGNGRWTLRFRVYDADAYDLELHSAPNQNWSDLPNHGAVPVPSGLVLTQAQDGTGRYIITAYWNPVEWPFWSSYYVELWDGTTLVQSVDVLTVASVSPSLGWYWQSGPVVAGTYTVKVRVRSTENVLGEPLDDSIIVAIPGTGPYGGGVVRYDKVEIDDEYCWLDNIEPVSGREPTWRVSSTGAQIRYRRTFKDWILQGDAAEWLWTSYTSGSPAEPFHEFSGTFILEDQFQSLLTTGTAPFAVLSTTMCSNLNADMVDGYHAADLLGGTTDWPNPGTIGSATPNTGQFTWLEATTAVSESDTVGTVRVRDSTALAANVGGRLVFSGKYTGAGAYTELGAIEGYKANATDGNVAGGVIIRYRAAGSTAFTTGITLSETGIVTLANRLRTADGDAAAPSHSFANDTDTGIYGTSDDTIHFATAGTERASIDGNGHLRLLTSGGRFLAPDGTQNNPSYGFKDEFSHDTGIYHYGSNEMAIATGGAIHSHFAYGGNLSLQKTNAQFVGKGGNNTSPTFAINAGDEHTGFFQQADNVIGVALNGSEYARFDPSFFWHTNPLRAGIKDGSSAVDVGGYKQRRYNTAFVADGTVTFDLNGLAIVYNNTDGTVAVLFSYDSTAASMILTQDSTAKFTTTDPGSGGNAIYVSRPAANQVRLTNRYGAARDIGVLVLSAYTTPAFTS